MALYRLSMSIIGRGGDTPQNAVAAAAYRGRERLHDREQGRAHDYSRLGDHKAGGVELPENAPTRYADREKLANLIEWRENQHKKHATAQLWRDVMVPLPRELDTAQQCALVRRFVRDEYTSRGMAAVWDIHETPASDGGTNPHAHILLTFRRFEEENPLVMGNKAREWNAYFRKEADSAAQARGADKGERYVGADNGKTLLRDSRGTWAKLVNEALEEAGSDARVDHRSYAERGMDKQPGLHLGKGRHTHEHGRGSDQVIRHAAHEHAGRLHESERQDGLSVAVRTAQRIGKQLAEQRAWGKKRPESVLEAQKEAAGRVTPARGANAAPEPPEGASRRVVLRGAGKHRDAHRVAFDWWRHGQGTKPLVTPEEAASVWGRPKHRHPPERDREHERDDGEGHER